LPHLARPTVRRADDCCWVDEMTRRNLELIEPLRDWCFFWDWDPVIHQVRWMTAWDTTDEDIESFAAGVRVLAG
jgi:threonine aldolase